ncbi:M24 family metallopeptidase [Mycolicibacterium insubricum]|uniref:M24 family metallopeptidase n=1 Tax=Mycolicibacterium insubricum TaxID=444597 RepID=UPI0021F36602|nr:Xaa-Pro peptidase family protein [Mycolicibacterium insubricum]MCV7082535.1 aminopeptidase P family protein [Mycolicibacterium insubricum]
MTQSRRRVNLAAACRARGLDAMLVSDLDNVRYLSGFTGSNAALLVYADDRGAVLATDGRYRTQATAQAPDLETVITRSLGAALGRRAADDGVHALGFESHVMTVDAHAALSDLLAELPGVRLVRARGLVEALREIKDAGEIALLRGACAVADTALTELIERGGLRPGRTEREVRNDLEALMLAGGADGPSFETIVATGVNSAVPHHRPTGATLAAGDFVKIDFGARVGGYHSDMTRTFVLGRAADWQREIYALVADAQRAGRHALKPGAVLADVDAAARGHRRRRLRENFGHGLGHGVGLQIHEAPGINATATGTLPAGAAVTVEPGVYLPGRGGVRIEDTLIVAGDTSGAGDEQPPELLTRFPKELNIL